MRAMRLAPSERYQGADEMLADVERVLRNEFHSAGQTELKLWLEQLARRDAVAPIGKQRLDTSGVVKDMLGTDLSAGTSFELDDLDQASGQTELALASALAGARQRPRPTRSRRAERPPRCALRKRRAPRRRSGFWFGVILTLAAVVGLKYVSATPMARGVLRALGFGRRRLADAALGGRRRRRPRRRRSVAPRRPRPRRRPPRMPRPRPPRRSRRPRPRPSRRRSRRFAPPTPGREGRKAPDGRREGARQGARRRPKKAEKKAEKPGRTTSPTRRRCCATRSRTRRARSSARRRRRRRPRATPGKSRAKPHPAAAKAGGPAKVETAVLHLTSAPGGAIVKTKARVLGRTPINLHFKAGNTYEIVFVKRGYQPATRRVAVQGAKDKKIAVTLKKRPPAEEVVLPPAPMRVRGAGRGAWLALAARGALADATAPARGVGRERRRARRRAGRGRRRRSRRPGPAPPRRPPSCAR